MTDSKTTFGLNPMKIASLLKLGSGPCDAEPAPTCEQEKSELLQDRLAARLCHEGLPGKGLVGQPVRSSLQDHILDRSTPIAVLRQVKEHGAGLSRSARSEGERQTANVIYYAAIANALIWHHEKISEFSVEDLTESFSILEKLPWLTPGIAGLFHQAVQACRDDPGRTLRSETP